MSKVGSGNAITDVPGVLVGQAGDAGLRSGVTVVLPERPAVAAVDLRGGGTGTRETALLDPAATVETVHAIVLSGGSAFGLEAASGVVDWLAERGRGFPVLDAVVPIVPAAILFDLANGGDKNWGENPPYRSLGRAAAEAAGRNVGLGNAGAGIGATAGPLKGGQGTASLVLESGVTVGALAVVNSLGSVVMPESSAFWAWPFERGGELGGQVPPSRGLPETYDYAVSARPVQNTTLVTVACDAVLSKAQAQRVAIMAQDGLARAIHPVHTPLDGDTLFVIATGSQSLQDPLVEVAVIGSAAADCVARAVARGVYEADSIGDWKSYRETFGLLSS